MWRWSMRSLVENLELAAKLNTELTELIHEAHSAIKALRQAERDVREATKDLVDKHTSEALRPVLEEMSDTINARLQETADHVLAEFAKVSDPLMDSIEMLSGMKKETKGAFFLGQDSQ
jgi:hypothetical protein